MILNLWKLLPRDTRVELSSLDELPSKILNKKHLMDLLSISEQQLRRYKNRKSNFSKTQIDTLERVLFLDLKSKAQRFGLEASSHLIELPKSVTISRDLAWLIGFHCTESSETPKSYGICNTEINLVQKALNSLTYDLSLSKSLLKLEIRYNDADTEALILQSKKILGLDGSQIRLRKLPNSSKSLYTLRVNSRLFRDIMDNLEQLFLRDLESCEESIMSAYVKGIFDADAWFNTSKRIIVLAQKDKTIIDRVCHILKILGIKTRFEYWKYRNFYVCVVLNGERGINLYNYSRKVGFFHDSKATKVKNSIVSQSRS